MATLSAATAWKIKTGLAAATAWKIRTALAAAVAWKIKTGLSAATAWKLKNQLEAETAWRIQPALAAAVAWKIRSGLSAATAWKIKNRPNGAVAWKILSDADDIPGLNSHTVSVTAAGTAISPAAIGLNCDLDSMAWSCSLTLTSALDFSRCPDGAAIIVGIDAMTWTLKVSGRDSGGAFADNRWQVTAVSAFAAVADEQVSLTLSADTLVSDVAAAVAGSGVSFAWAAANWDLPAELKIAENATRRETLADLAEAIGAVVVSTPAGELKVSPGMPLPGTAPAFAWTTDRDCDLGYSREITPAEAYNRVLCGSEGLYRPRTVSIEMIEQDDVARTATLAVRVNPDPVPPTVSDCGPSTITLSANAEVTATETETVSFADGVGTLANVETITNVDWGGHTDLGAVTIMGDGSLLAATAGDSIAEITYTTKYYEYMVVDSAAGEVATTICAAVDPIRADIIVDYRSAAAPLTLSPEVLTHKFRTAETAAKERARVYLARHAGDIETYNLNKVWDGTELPAVGSLGTLDGAACRLVGLEVKYVFPAVTFSAAVELT